MGFVFDIFGRRITVFVSVFGGALVLLIAPLGAPDVSPFVYIIRGVYVIFTIGSSVHPLVNDYVQKESRGKASAL